MSVVVAVRDQGEVWMAADSLASNDSIKLVTKTAKIRRIGEVLVGSAGSFAGLNALWSAAPTEKPQASLYAWAVDHFVPWIREWFRARELRENDNGAMNAPCRYLLACGNQFVEMDYDFGVVEPAEDWHAIGSGSTAAKGALMATGPYELESARRPEERVLLAVAAACSIDPFCGGPIQTERTRGAAVVYMERDVVFTDAVGNPVDKHGNLLRADR